MTYLYNDLSTTYSTVKIKSPNSLKGTIGVYSLFDRFMKNVHRRLRLAQANINS